MVVADVNGVALFDGCDEGAIASLARTLQLRTVSAGERLMQAGESSTFFALVVSGELTIDRSGVSAGAVVSVADGAIVGELGLLTGRPRSADVTAAVASRILVGGASVFAEMLDIPALHDRLVELATLRLANNVPAVSVTTASGFAVVLRPLLPSDRDALVTASRDASRETLRKRFFTANPPSDTVIDYLVHINYIDHFAWVAHEADAPAEPPIIGVARYIRHRERADAAEVAFTVLDAHQGRGLGKLMLGAVAVTAEVAGIDQLNGLVLADNMAIRGLFSRAGARFSFFEPGVLNAEFPAAQAVPLLNDAARNEVRSAVSPLLDAWRHD